ncbi:MULTISPECIES: cell division protein SepF [Congzhengia]|jgi:cell division inhibitor SepF|uniref:Cell division protein SepF n=1 Tax=Congzhengia minquanensis TaxID=2763657 RepID=A0A926DP63_9FIRM|nr:cell division protein SepF [Congzhengia minquanensis]MBC8541297.1 cell division protein SepF [Congzhengia minquanensis]MBD8945893.1 DUF552 domain-containing protein [Clostridiales bacterium]HBL82877.1 cell division protein SepF [Clostridiales bacterium]
MSAMNKMLKWIGIAEEDDEEFFDTETDMDEAVEPAMPLGRKAKVSSISGGAPSRVVVIQFQNFDDAKDAADHLKNKKPVVANLEKLDNDTTRRVVDFLSGAVYGVAGRIQNVSNRIFLITPANVEVTGNYQDNIKGFPFVN